MSFTSPQTNLCLRSLLLPSYKSKARPRLKGQPTPVCAQGAPSSPCPGSHPSLLSSLLIFKLLLQITAIRAATLWAPPSLKHARARAHTHSLTRSLLSLSLPYTRHSSSISLTALLSLSIYFFKEWPPQIHSHPLRLFTKQPERSFQNTDVITSPIILVVPKVDIRILHTTYPYRPHVASPRDPT